MALDVSGRQVLVDFFNDEGGHKWHHRESDVALETSGVPAALAPDFEAVRSDLNGSPSRLCGLAIGAAFISAPVRCGEHRSAGARDRYNGSPSRSGGLAIGAAFLSALGPMWRAPFSRSRQSQ